MPELVAAARRSRFRGFTWAESSRRILTAARRPTVQDVALIVVLGLTPLLWFREFVPLNVEDLMLPPNWHEFGLLWFTWNDELGTGAERILDSGRFPTLFVAAALQGLGASLVVAQAVQFVVWFTLPGLGMYWLMRAVARGPYARVAHLSAVLFYMFNLWLLSNWMGYKEPLIAGVAILPFALGIWLRTFQADAGYRRAVLATALVSLAAASMGNNISETLAIAAVLPIVFIVAAISSAARRDLPRAARIFTAGAATAAAWAIMNAFWIVPMAGGISRAAAGGDIATFRRTSVQFLEGQSTSTPLTNVVRILGDWTFHQGHVEPYRAFSATLLESPFFVALGYALPALAAVGALRGRGMSKAPFVTLALLGLILSAGLNAPWGGAYAWVFDNVPGAWIVRSPWFKFTLWTVLGYAVLLGLAAPVVAGAAARVLAHARRLGRGHGARASAVLALAVSVAVGPVYAYPFTLGQGFATADERTFLNPNHAHIPDYVDVAGAWFDDQPGPGRVLTIPGDAPWLYEWGFAGFGSILQWRTQRPVLFKHVPDHVKVSQGAPDPSGPLTEQLDTDLLDQRSGTVATTLARLGVGWVQHERDVRFDFYKGLNFREDDSPERVAAILAARGGIEPATTFGAWEIYRVADPRPRFWAASDMAAVAGLDARLTARILGSGWFDRLPLVPDGAAGSEAAHIRVGGVAPTVRLLDTRTLADAAAVATDAFTLSVGRDEDWGPHERLADGGVWRWFHTPRGEHYVAANDGPNPAGAELRLQVLSHARARDFYVYVNDELLRLESVEADAPTEIRIQGVRLAPGRNVISFYTPFPPDPRNGEHVSFAIAEHPRLVRSTFAWSPRVPASGDYEMVALVDPLDPAGGRAAPPSRLPVRVDGQLRLLPEAPPGSGRYTGTVPLRPDSRVTLQQQGREHYVLLIDDETRRDRSGDATIQVLDSGPTGYRLSVRTSAPFVLVFNESYHEGWQASVDGHTLPHVKVDTYANAYLVDRTGTFEIDLAFEPQRLFVAAVAVSAAAAALAVLALAVLRRRGR